MSAYNDFSRLELNLNGCLENYNYFRSKLKKKTKLLVLVKANAYGHGSIEFASMMQKAGADYLAVALPVEGAELRAGGISLPILVLTAGTDSFEEIINNRLEPGIPNLETLEFLCNSLQRRGIESYPIHIKFDTGMHRLGFSGSNIEKLCTFLNAHPEVKVKSVYSHLASAENPSDDNFTLEQVDKFRTLATRTGELIGYKPMWHILNSAGIERFPQYQFDMVRLGIGVYGISALEGVKLSPVASLKAKILHIQTLDKGDDTVGYGRKGKIGRDGTVIATIPVGYADGINRHLGCGKASFSLLGKRVSTIGNICMDMCMIDITDCPDAGIGDEVTIFGEDPKVEELADILQTIPYEILTGIPRRIPRIIKK